MDIEALKKLAKENSTFMNLDTSNYNEVILKCADTETVASVNQTIKDMGYGTQCLQEWIEQSEQSIKQTRISSEQSAACLSLSQPSAS